MYHPPLSLVLRLSEGIGTSYWCMKIDPAHGRPDLHPAKPWAELETGDLVVADDGTTYEVDRLVPLERPADHPSDDSVLPECRELIAALAGRSYRAYVEALPR